VQKGYQFGGGGAPQYQEVIKGLLAGRVIWGKKHSYFIYDARNDCASGGKTTGDLTCLNEARLPIN
jgi:hypothetical protein